MKENVLIMNGRGKEHMRYKLMNERFLLAARMFDRRMGRGAQKCTKWELCMR